MTQSQSVLVRTSDDETLPTTVRLPATAEAVAVGVVAVFVAAYWAVSSILIHRAFHSNGWDLGLIDQVVWNTSEGRPFSYSFRDISYAGDHWQPILLLLVPIKWLAAGPEPLLVAQAVALAVAVVPLYAFVRQAAGYAPAAALSGGYLVGLGAARAVSFDFHTEAFAPLLAFSALWALGRGLPIAFLVCGLLTLTLKEDGALLALALAWIAWIAFGQAKAAAVLAGVSVVYGYFVTALLIPHFRGDDLNPFLERYSYLGDTPLGVVFGAITHPHLVAEQLLRIDSVEAIILVLASAAFLPLLAPRLWPALALVMVIPLLSKSPSQGDLELHYFLVPSLVALTIAAVVVRTHVDRQCSLRLGSLRLNAVAWPVMAFAVPVLLFAFLSPLPPSFSTDWRRFDVDDHATLAADFVGDIPPDARVSAQSPFVPHLAERTHIHQFPRILDAEFVLLDAYGPVPAEDHAAGYDRCLASLPQLGFDRIREEDGFSLWQRTRPAETATDAPPECSGRR